MFFLRLINFQAVVTRFNIIHAFVFIHHQSTAIEGNEIQAVVYSFRVCMIKHLLHT
jgi:hypothetical protein